MSATLSATYRTLLVSSSETTRTLLGRLLDGADIVIDDAVEADQVIASVARRAPDLIVIDVETDAATLARVCGVLKANPTTLLVPLIGLAKSAKQRVLAFEAGVDDFLTHQIRRDEFLVRVRSLLKVSAARRQLAAEQLAEEVKRRELIRAAFRRYISPKLADQILASPELLDSMFAGTNKRTLVAVMFADMRGFTALSERLNPEHVVELLNEFFKLLTDITFEYEGTVFSMAGDSLLVGFGVPVAQEDGAERSILAAKLMLEQFAELAHRWKDRYGVETGLGIGINVGEVIAGNVGSPSYMNYTIIGDTVNVASRLGQRARAGEMLFSDAVKNLLDKHGVDVGAMPLPSLVLRGRSSPIGIFCVPTSASAERVDFRPTDSTAH
ncbi:adenylate/guanylate cyclase domain-containing protein [Steroidobacter sp.]|uniref:adenylate/guanylate cyclase domain-containing protein n=1 Tax=Steroidobacter sp. TaxID=1978227 RepID=UPI001A4E711A|nr:adenylate/guanylate cyclase domain-containing protein [Steroidobacter sp.]MBL8265524.1 response regulator [Steroidobacter sp.]